jgi:hypothetical protein
MRAEMIWIYLLVTIAASVLPVIPPPPVSAAGHDAQAWKIYTNARFGFSVHYPEQWRLGNPLPDGTGVTLHPPIDHSLIALSGHMNLIAGTSQDRRQTLDEFAAAHRRIITDLYAKKMVTVKWRQGRDLSLAGFPAKQLTFTYSVDTQGEMIEHHIFSLGRNEGRGIRIKLPLSAETQVLPAIMTMLETYQPGRDQNAVSPLLQKDGG